MAVVVVVGGVLVLTIDTSDVGLSPLLSEPLKSLSRNNSYFDFC